jgi:hypothetical protein
VKRPRAIALLGASVALAALAALGLSALERLDLVHVLPHASRSCYGEYVITWAVEGDFIVTVRRDGHTVAAERLRFPALGRLSPREPLWEVEVGLGKYPVQYVDLQGSCVTLVYPGVAWMQYDAATGRWLGTGSG